LVLGSKETKKKGTRNLITWAIWKTRNAFIFQGTTPSLYRARALFKEDFKWIKF
jgi:hypothetical protein